MEKWTFRDLYTRPFVKPLMVMVIGLIIAVIWYLASKQLIIIKW